MSQRFPVPVDRICVDCLLPFTTNWAQRLCNNCKYGRATRGTCATCGSKTSVSGRDCCAECRYGPEPELLTLSPTDLTWMTGILEGEGTFTLKRAHGAIRVAMTDHDIVERLHAATGVGLVHERPPRTPRCRPSWDWDVI